MKTTAFAEMLRLIERDRDVVAFYLRVILYSCLNKIIIIIIIIIILSLILDTFLSSSFNLRMLCVGKFGHYMFRPE